MKIQIDIPKDISKKLGVYKIEHDLQTKADAIIEIIKGELSPLEKKGEASNSIKGEGGLK